MEEKPTKPKGANLKAVALKYAKASDNAPKLVAKGRGKLAEKIIETAKKYDIPVTEDRELVELLSHLDMYQEIPEELYKAVAEILAYIYTISKTL
ncbi:MAG: EscU/YscU/HrcU family type III secretion system export apparatus switch protein [Nitrospirae bacterium]|nr:EscU/YscU/HrcU family type III secretion system export apparatus switch protein [Nitrospirota bacterium]MBF0541181.1 EscU/YscU/HrcU family type III secretion system export apparatus switch protein [Nitrospirota bacterium]